MINIEKMSPIRPLSNELQKKAESELNEVPSRIQDDLQQIQDWLLKQPHLKVKKDEQILIGFLRGCKFSVQRAKEKIDFFHTMRTLLPEFFDNRDPLSPEIQEVLSAGAVFPLPNIEDAAASRVFMLNWNVCNPNKIPFTSFIKAYFMSMDVLMLEDDNCMVSGIRIWSDMTKWSLDYILQMTPSNLKKTMMCLQNAYPMRIKGIYFTNAPSAFEIIFNLTKPFMTAKLTSRVIIYSEKNSNNLHNHIHQSLLPVEYGGNTGSVREIAATWKKKLESYREWFLEDALYRSDERLRAGVPKTSAEVFGVEGTFRKLVVD